jgi:hypothetical protein
MCFLDGLGVHKIDKTPCGWGASFSEFIVRWKIQTTHTESSEKIGFAHLQMENLMCLLISLDNDI